MILLEGQTLFYTEGDTDPPIDGTIEGPIDGWTITLELRYLPAALVKTATIIDPGSSEELGQYRFQFAADDLLPGDWDAVIRFVPAEGEAFTATGLRIQVRARFPSV